MLDKSLRALRRKHLIPYPDLTVWRSHERSEYENKNHQCHSLVTFLNHFTEMRKKIRETRCRDVHMKLLAIWLAERFGKPANCCDKRKCCGQAQVCFNVMSFTYNVPYKFKTLWLNSSITNQTVTQNVPPIAHKRRVTSDSTTLLLVIN